MIEGLIPHNEKRVVWGTRNLTLESGLNYSYVYDAENHLVNFNTGTSVFVYDGNGLRVQKTNAGTTTTYIFAGRNILAEYLGNSGAATPAREFIYADNQYLATISGGTTTYYHPDHLSIRLLTNSDGTWSGERGHFPFGEAWFDQGTFTRNAFTNYKRETESFTDYAMFRYYSNRQGRLQMADPMIGSVSWPQTWNRYSYVLNDPINFTDPLGLCLGGSTWQDDQGNVHVDCFEPLADVVTMMSGPPAAMTADPSGGGAADTNKSVPWYKNPCIQSALAKGAATTALDAIGTLPEGGTVAAAFSLYNGAAGASNGTKVLGRVAFAGGLISTSVATHDLQGPQESALSTAVTGLQAVAGGAGIAKGLIEDIPVAGQVFAAVSVGLDVLGTAVEVYNCRR